MVECIHVGQGGPRRRGLQGVRAGNSLQRLSSRRGEVAPEALRSQSVGSRGRAVGAEHMWLTCREAAQPLTDRISPETQHTLSLQ